MLSIITEIIPDLYHRSVKSLIFLLGRTLSGFQDNLGNTISYFILKTIKNISNYVLDFEVCMKHN